MLHMVPFTAGGWGWGAGGRGEVTQQGGEESVRPEDKFGVSGELPPCPEVPPLPLIPWAAGWPTRSLHNGLYPTAETTSHEAGYRGEPGRKVLRGALEG